MKEPGLGLCEQRIDLPRRACLYDTRNPVCNVSQETQVADLTEVNKVARSLLCLTRFAYDERQVDVALKLNPEKAILDRVDLKIQDALGKLNRPH